MMDMFASTWLPCWSITTSVYIYSPSGKTTRPTTDRTREFLFSYLGDVIDNAILLDLFAGTGSVGIEALSRNAAKVIFVDNSYKACELIKRNLNKIREPSPVFVQTEKAFLNQAIKQKLQFDIIFCDPPYNYRHFFDLLQTIDLGRLLKENGSVIYESGSKEQTVIHDAYKIVKEKILGDTKITIYQLHETDK